MKNLIVHPKRWEEGEGNDCLISKTRYERKRKVYVFFFNKDDDHEGGISCLFPFFAFFSFCRVFYRIPDKTQGQKNNIHLTKTRKQREGMRISDRETRKAMKSTLKLKALFWGKKNKKTWYKKNPHETRKTMKRVYSFVLFFPLTLQKKIGKKFNEKNVLRSLKYTQRLMVREWCDARRLLWKDWWW